MTKTSIEWVKNPDGTQGNSWNPLRGVKGNWHCTKISPGCVNCYAERINQRFCGPSYTVGADTIRLDERVLVEPLRWRKPRMVFVCSMTDLFHEDIDPLWIKKIFDVMRRASDHTFQILTKRPKRAVVVYAEDLMIPYVSSIPGNVWFGISCEDQQRADERVPILLQIPAAVRWVSAEPLLGPIDMTHWLSRAPHNLVMGNGEIRHVDALNWIVVGGESGPGRRRFDPEWARDLLRQCRSAGVPFFGKQWDKVRNLPPDLMIREWPTGSCRGIEDGK